MEGGVVARFEKEWATRLGAAHVLGDLERNQRARLRR
jgi:hypothetical protein